MGRDSEDKAGRILSIYTRLKQGKVIYKQEESIRCLLYTSPSPRD